MADHPPTSGVTLDTPSSTHAPAALTVGAAVCVWNSFLQRWTDGFVVAEVLDDGYRLRRRSDGHVFVDDVFPRQSVIAERRSAQLPGYESPDADRRQRPAGTVPGSPDPLAD